MSNELFEVTNCVTESEFVNALNAKYPEAAIKRFEEIYWTSPNAQPLSRRGAWEIPDAVLGEEIPPVELGVRGAHLRRMFEKQRATQPIRTALIGCYLRQLVDTWLEAGRKPDGSESPASRRLTIPMLLEVEDYLDKYPSFRPNLNDRGIEIEIASPDMVLSERGVIERSWNFFDAQKQSALRLFVGMLASDWKERICKCRDPRCGRYFLIPKARENYLSGTFCCRAHATRTAAARCMQKNRANAKMGLIEEAARYLSDVGAGPGWVTDSRIRLKVVRHLCLVIERRKRLQAYYYNWLKANWVTLHRDAIEQKRLEHVPHRPRVIAARRGR